MEEELEVEERIEFLTNVGGRATGNSGDADALAARRASPMESTVALLLPNSFLVGRACVTASFVWEKPAKGLLCRTLFSLHF